MKYILLVLLTSVQLFALNIFLNSAKENGLPYAILHVIDTEPVDCRTVPMALDKKNYICQFKKILKSPIKEKRLRLVNIDFLEKNNEFYIKINPKAKSRLIPMNEELYKNYEVTSEYSKGKTKHWVILLYDKSPFGKKENNNGINFPITYDKNLMPSIGSVDLNGAPIAYARREDINYYLEIQKEFENNDYYGVVKDVDKALRLYPNSLFKSDLLLYKLKVMDIAIEKNIQPISDNYTNADVASLAKSWIREFTSSENIPQALFILVKDYLRIGSSSDVNYFLDTLVNEHKTSPYTKRAILYYADSLYVKGKKEKAIKLYEDVLYSAKDLDIASLAAIRLASSKISAGKTKEAKGYLMKVLDANKKYLLKDKAATHELAQKLAANGLQGIAATISDLLLENLKKGQNDEKELLLKESGDWYAHVNKINKAYDRYMQYKKRYKDGIYINEVNRALDELFFKIKDTNETKLLKYYNILISKYHNGIRDKAVLQKAKLFLKQKKYQQVLDMKGILKTAVDKNSTVAKEIIDKAATVLLANNLREKKCVKSISLLENFNLELRRTQDKDELFTCLMRTARYKKAEKLTTIELNSKELTKKFKWLENRLHVEAKLQKYNDIINLKKDLFTLSKILKKKISAPSYRYIFDAYLYNKSLDKSLDVLGELEKKWPNDIKNIEPYYKIVNYANNKRDDLLLIKYAKKIISLQEKNKIYLFSPKVEFLYIGALKRLFKTKEASKIAIKLEKMKLNDKDKSRVFYVLGELSLKLKDNKKAKEYFTKCSSIKTKNSWNALCIDSLKLF